MKRINTKLLFIVLIGVVLRFLFLDKYPVSLNWDEVSHGLNAFAIRTTFKDEWGEFLPIIFRAYGDYKLPVYIYLTALSQFFLGINEFSVRFVSALAGTLSIVFTYLIARTVFPKIKNTAYLSAFLVAIEPWTLFISRPAFEANLALTFFLIGLYFLLHIFERKQIYLYLAIIFLSLTLWTYNSYRVFTPLFMFLYMLLNYKQLAKFILEDKLRLNLSALLLIIFFVPFLWQFFDQSGAARYTKVAIIDEGAINYINSMRGLISNEYNPTLAKIVANKVTYFTLEFFKNYLSYFSPIFLYFNGGTQYQFSIPGNGLLYIINLPFFIIGIFKFMRSKNNFKSLFLTWIILSPVAASLTREDYHVLRFTPFLPIPMIMSAYGISTVLNFFKSNLRNIFTIVYLLLVMFSLEGYLGKYFNFYANNYSSSWQYGYKQAFNYLVERKDDYSMFVISKKYGEPHAFLLFYGAVMDHNKFSIQSYLNSEFLNRFNQSGWWWVDGFGDYYFVNDWDMPKEGRIFNQESGRFVDCRFVKCMLITSPNNHPEGWNKLKEIKFLDGSIAFEIYENF